jgi:flagellar hook-associated protein 2
MTSPTSSTSSISGLISGMDTSSVISQLMQIEAQPQSQLKVQLSTSQTDAAAYRDVNSAFAALATAASALTSATTWASASATSSDPTVSATSTAGATQGSLTFSVDRLATTHSVMATSAWAKTTDPYNLGSTLTITSTDGTQTFGTIKITSSTTGAASLNDAIAAINKSGLGLSAAAIQTSTGYALQVTATSPGAAKAFKIKSDTDASGADYAVGTQGVDAQISFPNPSNPSTPYTSTSATNTFSNVLSGTNITVSQKTTTPVTVNVVTDPNAIANAVQAMVTAANNALAKISAYTDSSSGSTAPLKGDYSLISLTGQVLDAVSSSVGTSLLDANGKPITSSGGSNGVQLTRDGQLTFDAAAFKTAYAANPAMVQAVFSGTTAAGADGIPNTADDTVAVDGIGARLSALANQASDKATGILTGLANGQDTRSKDIQSQIDAWTLRLTARQQTLTDQFTAMETALGTLKSQSSWLTSQINSLPTISKSS